MFNDDKIVESISLGETAREKLEGHFRRVETVMEQEFGESVSVFIQGSYGLGTSIRPLRGTDEDFDIDIVVKMTDSSVDPSAYRLRILNIVNDEFSKHNVFEKRRSIRIEYTNSHTDVVPAIIGDSEEVEMYVTDNKSLPLKLVPSSPLSFKKWFSNVSGKEFSYSTLTDQQQRCLTDQTPLHRITKLLKRSRDVYFDGHDLEDFKPISMLLTTIAGSVYASNHVEINAIEELKAFVESLKKFVESSEDDSGNYLILNPVNKNENFADKWTEKPELKSAFFEWIHAVLRALEVDVHSATGETALNSIFGAGVAKALIAHEIKRESLSLSEKNFKTHVVKPHTFFGGRRMFSNKKQKDNIIRAFLYKGELQGICPDSNIAMAGNNKNGGKTLLYVNVNVESVTGREYPITIVFDKKTGIDVYLNTASKYAIPKSWPHTYGYDERNDRMRLCLYYPLNDEFTSDDELKSTILPWTVEWLSFFEVWNNTGHWLGGGIAHE
ncbi:nucleotidyltransferase [Weissella confusa]|uniref:nucleotidyltransferase domain-containing protein n=1 Tax=Weissella confusa TaxID=1583 RepID=UPI0022E96019|nr:nucleotidyltransferase [Weissella confusa]